MAGQGRWRVADHIALGGGRFVVEISSLTTATPEWHRTVLPMLEDTQGVSRTANKGRSPAHHLNHMLRQKAAAALASRTKALDPRVGTTKQPADQIEVPGQIGPARLDPRRGCGGLMARLLRR